MKYLPLVWAALFRHKLRSTLTLLSVTVAFALFGTMMGLDASFQRLADLASRNAVSVFARFGNSLTDAMGRQIARLPDVSIVSPAAQVYGYHQTPKNNAFVVLADPAASRAWYSLPLTRAQWAALAKEPDGVYISRMLAAKWDQKPGSDFTILSQQPRADGSKVWHFKVLDVLPDVPNYPSGFSTGNYHYFDQSRPLADQSKPDAFLLLVKESANGDTVAEAIDNMFANSAIPTLSQSDYSGQQTQAEGAVNVAAITRRVAAVGLFMILLLTGHGIAQSVRERRAEFAMLKTLGFSDWDVTALVFAEALAPCVIGAALGVAIAAAVAPLIPATLPNLGLPKPYFPPELLFEAIAAAALVAFLGATLPARKLKRLNVAALLSGR